MDTQGSLGATNQNNRSRFGVQLYDIEETDRNIEADYDIDNEEYKD